MRTNPDGRANLLCMTSLTAFVWPIGRPDATTAEAPPKLDWPLMSDVSTIRAGVPEVLVLWRRARGEPAPRPSDPDLVGHQNSL